MWLLFLLPIVFGASAVKTVERHNPGNVVVPMMVYATLGERGIITLPQVNNYRRIIANEDEQINDEQWFIPCNGKNKNKCGVWRSVVTKKVVPSGATHYDSKLKALVVQNMTKNDLGVYMSGKEHYRKFTYVMQKFDSGK